MAVESNGKNRKSIITDKPVAYQTAAASMTPQVGWYVDRFETLIQTQGYDAYIDRAMRCPCVDRATGQALSTCRNCLGRGWFFVDRTETRVIAQSMDNKKQYLEWSEINRGTAKITTKGVDKVGFMDRVILLQLEEFYSEILHPVLYDGELLTYPVYEPLSVTNMFLYIGDYTKLMPLTESMYTIDRNKIVFDKSIINYVPVEDVNQVMPPISISVRYSHYPTYNIIDVNRELMRVRAGKFCEYNDTELTDMPILSIGRKSQFIYNPQKFGEEAFENTVFEEE